MKKIDWSFIAAREGGRILRAYVPTNRKTGEVIGRSGVTVATGVDIGQRDRQGIVQLHGLSDALKRKLLPYILLKGDKAVKALKARPLTLSPLEAESLDLAVRNETVRELERRYDAQSRFHFVLLPSCLQTVLYSLAYNFGPALDRRLPRTWALALEMKIPELAHALYHFPSKQPELAGRRRKEADLLAAYLKS